MAGSPNLSLRRLSAPSRHGLLADMGLLKSEPARRCTDSIRRRDWVLILARTGDDNRRRGEPGWFREVRGYGPHTAAGELDNLSRDPGQRVNRYDAEPEKVRKLAALMERYVWNGRSTPGPKQKNDVEVVWDRRAK